MSEVFLLVDAAIVGDASWWNTVGAATPVLALQSGDADYMEFDPSDTGSQYLFVYFQDLSLPSLAYITTVLFSVRDRREAGAGIRTRWFFVATSGQPYAQFGYSEVPHTAFLQAIMDIPRDPLGAPWTVDTVNDFHVALTGAGQASLTDYEIAEVFLAVQYSEVPAPVITGPASPVTDTSKPTFTWTVNDPDGDEQNRFQLVIRNKNSPTIIYDSGIVFANTQSHQITSPLPNGNYDVTLRLGDAVNPNMSPYTSIYSLTISAPLPGRPLLTATAEPALNRVRLDLTTVAGIPSANTEYHAIERSDDGGLTWKVVEEIVNPRGALRSGGSTYLSVGDFHDFAGNVPFTLEAKVAKSLPFSGTNPDPLFTKANATDGWEFHLTDPGGALALFRRAAGVTQTVTGGVITIGLPHHLAATYDGANMRLYLDGVLVGGPTASALALPNTAADLILGGTGPPSGASAWAGNIEELRIWNVARSAAEILANMNTDFVGNEYGLVDLWKFDEGEGTVANSSVAGGHPAILNSNLLWINSAWKTEVFYDYTAPLDVPLLYRARAVHDIAQIVYTQSPYTTERYAVRVDGVNDYLAVGDFHDFAGTASFTVEARFRAAAIGASQLLVDKSNEIDGWYLFVAPNGQVSFVRVVSSVYSVAGGGSIQLDTSAHVAGTYDGTTMRIYLNGTLVGSSASSSSLANTALILALGGRSGGAFPLNGILEEARIWNVARSQAQIQANMNANLIGNESGLVDLWEFAEGTGTTTASAVAGGHTATLTNGPLWIAVNDWTAVPDSALLSDARAVWLKSIVSPALNMEVAMAEPDLDSTSGEDLVVYEALGRTYPVIFGGTVRSEYFGRLRLITINDAEAAALEAIRATKSTVLVQTCFGDEGRLQKFLRLGRTLSKKVLTHGADMSTGLGMNEAQARVWEIEAWEVETPTTQGQ